MYRKEAMLYHPRTWPPSTRLEQHHLVLYISRLIPHSQAKDTEYVTRLGGAAALVKALASSQTEGLSSDPTQLAQRKQHFGTNRLPEVPPKWFISIWWGTLEDTLIRILIFGATVRAITYVIIISSRLDCFQVSTILGAAIPEQRAERTWTEGLGIWFAVGIVTLVST